jgi:hypothetical protein
LLGGGFDHCRPSQFVHGMPGQLGLWRWKIVPTTNLAEVTPQLRYLPVGVMRGRCIRPLNDVAVLLGPCPSQLGDEALLVTIGQGFRPP